MFSHFYDYYNDTAEKSNMSNIKSRAPIGARLLSHYRMAHSAPNLVDALVAWNDLRSGLDKPVGKARFFAAFPIHAHALGFDHLVCKSEEFRHSAKQIHFVIKAEPRKNDPEIIFVGILIK